MEPSDSEQEDVTANNFSGELNVLPLGSNIDENRSLNSNFANGASTLRNHGSGHQLGSNMRNELHLPALTLNNSVSSVTPNRGIEGLLISNNGIEQANFTSNEQFKERIPEARNSNACVGEENWMDTDLSEKDLEM